MICSRVLSRLTSKREGCWIEQVIAGWSLTSMERGKPLANAPYPRLMTCPHPLAGWMMCVLLATGVANVGRWSGHGQRYRRHIVTSGSAVSGAEGTGAIGKNCARGLRPFAGILRRINSKLHARGSRLDGQYGNGAVLSDVAGFAFVTRGKDYDLLNHPQIQARLHWPPDQSQQRPESQMARSLYDCPQIPVGPEGKPCRVIVATHPAGKKKSPVGVTRAGIVYELFFTNLPQHAFTTCDVVELYLHRGAFEPALSDEDREQDPDRWCSHSAWGQECWQTVSQWVWNLRLELGHQLEPTPVRITEFAPAISEQNAQAATRPTLSAPASGYGPPTTATSWKTGRFTGHDFPLQPDGTLRCPAGSTLTLQERRQEADGNLRLVYAASIRNCRPCPLREQCQWNGSTTAKPRQVSVLLHPLVVAPEPILWKDWSRRHHRRACMYLLHRQRVDIQMASGCLLPSTSTPPIPSRTRRAHFRLSWAERLKRNVRPATEGQVKITLFGVPDHFADFLGLRAA